MNEATTIAQYEDLYYGIARDIGLCNDWMASHIERIQSKRNEIKEKNKDMSIAALDREFEQTVEYKEQKTYQYTTEGLIAMKNGIRVKIESLKAESHGQY